MSLRFLALVILAELTFVTYLGLEVVANACYFGQEPDPSQRGRLRWVMSGRKRDHCACTCIRPGPLNTMPLRRPYKPFYTDTPLFTDDPEEIHDYFDCHDFKTTKSNQSAITPTSSRMSSTTNQITQSDTKSSSIVTTDLPRTDPPSPTTAQPADAITSTAGRTTDSPHTTVSGLSSMMVTNPPGTTTDDTPSTTVYPQSATSNDLPDADTPRTTTDSSGTTRAESSVTTNPSTLLSTAAETSREITDNGLGSDEPSTNSTSSPSSTTDLRHTTANTQPMTHEPQRTTADTQKSDCHDLFRAGYHTSGVYTIYPSLYPNGLAVYCDMTERDNLPRGWIVFQRRQDGSVNFTRNWTEYSAGFGNLTGEFWLGNDVLRHLTSEGMWGMRTEVVLGNDNSKNVLSAVKMYFHFRVMNDDYKFSYGHCKPGNNDYFLEISNGRQFSTYDNDNDTEDGANCADLTRGGWWFGLCPSSTGARWYNLNGEYSQQDDQRGIRWRDHRIVRSEMMLRRYYPEDCEDWLENGSNVSGVYTIYPSQHPNGLEVYCDMDTAQGWIVIQRRQDGSANFTRTWDDYKNGFGNLTGEFWLGNDKLLRLSSGEPWTLRINLRDNQGIHKTFGCRQFQIKDENYRMSYRKCSQNQIGTSFESIWNGPTLSTYDLDNDYVNATCNDILKGGLWFGHCASDQDFGDGAWAEWKTRHIEFSEMKLRRYDSP